MAVRLPFQEIQPEAHQMIPRLLFAAEIMRPAAARQFNVRDGQAPAVAIGSGVVEAAPGMLSNGLLTVRLGSGGIAGIRRGATDLLGPAGSVSICAAASDTWTFHTDRWEEPVEATLVDASWHVEEAGPLRLARASMAVSATPGSSGRSVSTARESRVHLDLEVNFDERFSLLQMAIDLPAYRLAGPMASPAPCRSPGFAQRMAVSRLVAARG